MFVSTFYALQSVFVSLNRNSVEEKRARRLGTETEFFGPYFRGWMPSGVIHTFTRLIRKCIWANNPWSDEPQLSHNLSMSAYFRDRQSALTKYPGPTGKRPILITYSAILAPNLLYYEVYKHAQVERPSQRLVEGP